MDNVKRIFDIPYYKLSKFPQEISLAGKVGNEWKTYSTQEYIDLANSISRGLLRLGIKPGDKIVQFLLLPLGSPEIEEVPNEELFAEVSLRGEGGFGSTGVN